MKMEHAIWFSEGAGKEVRYLKPILDLWAICIERYGELLKQNSDWYDVPYWWGERQNVNVLSAAVWLAGWVTRTEFDLDEGQRADLLVVTPVHKYLIEAKHENMDLIGSNLSVVENTLREASVQCSGYANETPDTIRLAAVFLNMFVPTRDRDKFEQALTDLLSGLEDRIPMGNRESFYSTCFPTDARDLLEYDRDEDIVWPGVVLAGCRVPSNKS